MNRIALSAALAVVFGGTAHAQQMVPWNMPLGTNNSAGGFDSLKIIQPQSGRAPVRDIAQSDGTVAKLPSCASPTAINSFTEGIGPVEVAPLAAQISGVVPPLPDLEVIYVHPPDSGSSPVCSAQIVGWEGGVAELRGPQRWEWQTYAQDGQVMLQAAPQS
jgi:hypothetical protein